MKILIVATFFPPENSIASQRPYSWAKYWSRAGHDVTVLTTQKERRKDNWYPDCGDFKVISVGYRIPFSRKKLFEVDEVFSKDYIPAQQKEATESHVCVPEKKQNPVYRILRSAYDNFINKTGCFWGCRFPDWMEFWVKKAIEHVNPADYDVLVTTAWPYPVHRVGLYFKKHGFNGVWICDWRDLWTESDLFNGLAIFRPYERSLEKKFHRIADAVTTVSKAAADLLQEKYKIPVHAVYNGLDEEDIADILCKNRIKNERFTFVFTGSIHPTIRNPEPLFQALKQLLDAGKIQKEQIKILFAGNCDVTDLAEKYNLNGVFEYRGSLPLKEARELQYNADELLFIENDHKDLPGGALSGKIYEYMYLANSIMAIGCTNKSNAGEFIEKSRAGVCFGTDVQKIADYVEQRVKEWAEENLTEREKDWKFIKQFSREKQANQMLEIMESYKPKGISN